MSPKHSTQGNDLVFRVFFASTFGDFIAERIVLHERVFPDVREFCRTKGVRFLPIDLRYGISEGEVTDQHLVRACIEEVHRCQRVSPFFNFVALLGDRYGTRALAETIPQADFEKLISFLTPADAALAKRWYRLDENALPPRYILQPRGNDWQDNWKHMRDVLVKASSLAGTISADTRRILTTSITDQEIYAGVFEPKALALPILVRRHLPEKNKLSPEAQLTFFESTQQEESTDQENLGPTLLGRLHEGIESRYQSSIIPYPATLTGDAISPESLEWFYQTMKAALQQRIVDTIEQDAQQRANAPTSTTTFQMAFASDRLAHFEGQDAALATIDTYLAGQTNGTDNAPLIVTGPSGIGKTTLLLKAAEEACQRYPQAVQLNYFIGGSTPVSTTSELLATLEQDLATQYGREITLPQERTELEMHLRDCLAFASAEKPLIIFIDALDQLAIDSFLTRWIPMRLPNFARLVISILPGQALDALKARLGDTPPLELSGLPLAEAMRVFADWMKERGRTLTQFQWHAVETFYWKNPNPLALRVVVEFARRWPSWQTMLPAFPTTTPELIDLWLNTLEEPNRHGSDLPGYLLGMIGAGKNGLAEDELIGVINQQLSLHNHLSLPAQASASPTYTTFPMVLWARLYAEIDWMCTLRQIDSTRVLTFYHRQFREAIERRYLHASAKVAPANTRWRRLFTKLNTPTSGTAALRLHADLADYFGRDNQQMRQVPYSENTAQHPRAKVNERMVSELAYQYFHSQQFEKLKALLFDGEFLQARIQASKTSEALVDIGYIQGDPAVDLLREVITLSQPILDLLPQELPNQIFGRSATLWSMMHTWARWDDPHFLLESHTLRQPTDRNALLSRHQQGVMHTIFLDNEYALSTSRDRTLRIWNLTSGESSHPLDGHTGTVRYGAYDPNFQRIASASEDSTIILWDRTGTLLHTFTGHQGHVVWCGFTPDGRLLISASADGTIQVWHTTKPYAPFARFAEHTGPITTCALDASGALLASASADGTIRVWDIATRTRKQVLSDDGIAVTACLFTPDGRLVSGSADGAIRVWDLSTGTCSVLNGHEGWIYALALHPTRPNILLSASKLSGREDPGMCVWDIDAGIEKNRMTERIGDVRACGFANGGRTAIGATWGNKLLAWEWETPDPVRQLDGPTMGLNTCAIQGTLVIAGSEDTTIHIWDTTTWLSQGVLGGQRIAIRACAVNHAGDTLAYGLTSGEMILEDAASRGVIARWQAHTPAKWMRSCAFSPDGRFLLTASDDRRLLLWHLDTTLIHEFIDPTLITGTAHEVEIRFCTFSLDGQYVLSAGGNGTRDTTIRLWDRQSGDIVQRFTGHTQLAIECRFSPDGKTLYSASFDTTVKKWDVASGNLLDSVTPARQSVIRTCDMSQDGKLLVIGCSDGSLALIDAETLHVIGTIQAHNNLVNTCRFTADGRFVNSCSSDSTLKLWDTASFVLASSSGNVAVPIITWRGDNKTLICLAVDLTTPHLYVSEDDALHTLVIENLPRVEAELAPDASAG